MTNTSKNPLLPAYLLLGDDEAKKERLIARMKDRVAELGEISINTDEFHGENHEAGRVVSACLTLPFASEMRLVIVHDVDKMNASELGTLAEYLASPSDSSVLLMTATSLAKNTKLYKAVAAIGEQCIVACEAPKAYKCKDYVIELAKSKGLRINFDAAEKLVELVGTDTVALNNEMVKIVNSHTTTDAISASEVESLVAASAKVKAWVLVDAFSARNASKVIELLPKVTGTTPTGLLFKCVDRLRELIAAKECAKTGKSVASELGIPAQASWKVKNHSNWARLYTEEELLGALRTSLEAEQAMKSGAEQEATLKNWLISVMV